MSRRVMRIAMNGVTGRMGYRHHLVRSLLSLREQGGLELADGSVLWPEPVLLGRDAAKLEAIAARHGLEQWTTSLDEVLSDPTVDIYFDAQATSVRGAALAQAIGAGKAVYAEKPVASGLAEALNLAEAARRSGVANGVVQDKLFLPGIRKLRRLVEAGALGKVLSLRGEFGYWVFEGDHQRAQRPSWNYRAEQGGGIVMDMFCHWRYLLDGVIAPVRSVYAEIATHVPKRWDEEGRAYKATADDAAYAVFQLEGGVVAQVNSSWVTRVFRDELVEFLVDGTQASAVAGLRRCRFQHSATTPVAMWDPDAPPSHDFRSFWLEVPDNGTVGNAFKLQWEQFLSHVALGTPFPWDLLAGARGIQLAELALKSAREGCKVEVPALDLPPLEASPLEASPLEAPPIEVPPIEVR